MAWIGGEVRRTSKSATWFFLQPMRVPNVLQGRLLKGDVLYQELSDVLVNFL